MVLPKATLPKFDYELRMWNQTVTVALLGEIVDHLQSFDVVAELALGIRFRNVRG